MALGAPDDMDRASVAWFEAPDNAEESDGSLLWERRHAAEFARNRRQDRTQVWRPGYCALSPATGRNARYP